MTLDTLYLCLLRHVAGMMCVSMWVCVCVRAGTESCILWGVIGGTHCKQIFTGISKSPRLGHVLFTILSFSLLHAQTHTGRHINTATHAFTHIPYLLTRGFRPLPLSLTHSLSTLFPDSGASRLLYRFQEAGKTSLEFPSPPFQASRWRK